MEPDKGQNGTPPRDQHFNPWRSARSEAAKAFLSDIISQVQAYEQANGLRQRARKAPDQATFEATIEALICDLIYHHVTGSEGALIVPRSKDELSRKSRYRPAAYNKKLPTILDTLAALGLIDQKLGYQASSGIGQRTAIRPAHELIGLIDAAELAIDDLGQSDAREVIVLRSADDKSHLEYEDNKTTNRYRRELQEINQWLADADISYDDPDGSVYTTRRQLRRHFTRGAFNSGGRLFGGFWQDLTKVQRLAGLMINGESVVELDYDQMAIKTLYGLARVEPPQGDLYAIPGFEHKRDKIKKFINAMLFVERPLRGFPEDLKQAFKGYTADQVSQAVLKYHKGVDKLFFSGKGHYLQFVESNILVQVLLRLKRKGIAALPIHDAIIISPSDVDISKEAMVEAFKELVGSYITVSLRK